MIKMIDGEAVEMTEDEIAELAALRAATVPAPLPNLTMRKFRLGLLSAGLLDDVNAALDALPEPDRSVAKVEFEYAGEVVRTDPWVAALAGALGLMDAEIDALWTWAAGL